MLLLGLTRILCATPELLSFLSQCLGVPCRTRIGIDTYQVQRRVVSQPSVDLAHEFITSADDGLSQTNTVLLVCRKPLTLRKSLIFYVTTAERTL